MLLNQLQGRGQRRSLAALAFRRLAESGGVVSLDRTEKTATDGEKIEIERVHVHYRRRPRQLTSKVAVAILDATARAELLAPAFTGLRVETIAVQRPLVRVVQCHGMYAGKTALTTAPRAAALRQEIEGFLEQVTTQLGTGRGLLVTHKACLDLIALPEGKVGDDEGPQWRGASFGSLRGLDCYKDCDAIVVLGQPLPKARAVERLAAAMHYDSEVRIGVTGAYRKRAVAWRVRPGMATRAVPKGGIWCHEDPIVEAARWSACEGEVIQAASRGRLLHRDRPLTLYLIGGYPTLPADELVSWRALIGQPVDGDRRQGPGGEARLSKAIEAIGGYLPIGINWLAHRFPELWATPGAVKKDLERNPGFLEPMGYWPNQQAPVTNRTYKALGPINLPTVWRFRVEGQRGPATRLLTPPMADQSTARAWLATNIGPVVSLEPLPVEPAVEPDEDPFADADTG